MTSPCVTAAAMNVRKILTPLIEQYPAPPLSKEYNRIRAKVAFHPNAIASESTRPKA
jgi:hypothetical protein